jgi:hypothetical protein
MNYTAVGCSPEFTQVRYASVRLCPDLHTILANMFNIDNICHVWSMNVTDVNKRKASCHEKTPTDEISMIMTLQLDGCSRSRNLFKQTANKEMHQRIIITELIIRIQANTGWGRDWPASREQWKQIIYKLPICGLIEIAYTTNSVAMSFILC